MKKVMYLLCILLNVPRLLFPLLFLINKNNRKLTYEDLKNQHNIFSARIINFCYLLVFSKQYREIYFFRINCYNKFYSRIFKFLFPSRLNFELSGNINGGIVIHHGQSSVIHPYKAGKNFTIYQNVTVGRNKEHHDENGIYYPTFGDNVILYSGCVVAGGIHIGNNVEIGANSVVLNDVPDNSIVFGNPQTIKKKNK